MKMKIQLKDVFESIHCTARYMDELYFQSQDANNTNLSKMVLDGEPSICMPSRTFCDLDV